MGSPMSMHRASKSTATFGCESFSSEPWIRRYCAFCDFARASFASKVAAISSFQSVLRYQSDTGRSADRLRGCLAHHLDRQLLELPSRYRCGGVHHQVFGLLVHGEDHDLADV